jgi:hypothetical protein
MKNYLCIFPPFSHEMMILLERKGSNFCKILKYSHMAFFSVNLLHFKQKIHTVSSLKSNQLSGTQNCPIKQNMLYRPQTVIKQAFKAINNMK